MNKNETHMHLKVKGGYIHVDLESMIEVVALMAEAFAEHAPDWEMTDKTRELFRHGGWYEREKE